MVARSSVSTQIRFALGIAALSAFCFWSSAASADVSAWTFAGSGPVFLKQANADLDVRPALQFDVGVGTTPDARFIVGGFYRLTTMIGMGTDMSVLLRGATSGFQAGDFGIALDAGGYARFWEPQSYGFTGGLTFGAPLGLTLSLSASIGTNDAMAATAVLGFDFLRLTVFRRTMLEAWPNPGVEQSANSDEKAAQPLHRRDYFSF